VETVADDGSRRSFEVTARLDNDNDVDYLHHGGILPMVLRGLLQRSPLDGPI
jgi:aconitase A